MDTIISIIIAIVQLVAAVALMPRVKKVKPPEAQQAENPKAEAGPVAQVFGTVRVKAPNVLWYGDKSIHTYEISA
jgi:flagellar basal body-associated protein FliL